MSGTEICNLAFKGDIVGVRRKHTEDQKVVARKDESGRTAMHWAASGGHAEVMDFLLTQGAAVDEPDDDGWTPLLIASAAGRLAIVRKLITVGADVNAKTSTGGTPLIYAASKDRTEIVEMLLANGADPNSQDKNGSSALHRVAAQGHTNTLKMILGMASRLDVSLKDRWGNTPLHLACEENRDADALLLAEHGARLDMQNKEEKTPLDIAKGSLKRRLLEFTH